MKNKNLAGLLIILLIIVINLICNSDYNFNSFFNYFKNDNTIEPKIARNADEVFNSYGLVGKREHSEEKIIFNDDGTNTYQGVFDYTNKDEDVVAVFCTATANKDNPKTQVMCQGYRDPAYMFSIARMVGDVQKNAAFFVDGKIKGNTSKYTNKHILDSLKGDQ